ncbi:hypothetical protein M0805_005900 [Coniferiporia weirii]|nr:hypothetical protein M0805_005900 [Coniferiporia weirii]
MSWNFREHDQREEIAALKDQLSVQALRLGNFESQLLKNTEELNSANGLLEETTYKLRKEADRALELEIALGKRTDDLRNEKLTRENVEIALRTAREELKNQTSSARDAEHLINRLAQETNGTQQQHSKLLADKAKLEAQIRELQEELRRQQLAPPPLTKIPSRPRASSLTNFKVSSLEHDLAQARASASSTQANLDLAKEKLSKVQADLIRVENEKTALEKRMSEKECKLQDALEDKSDLERELDFFRSQSGAAEREEQLLARLEEEESKVTLLEQQLSQLSHSKDIKRSADKVQSQLRDEIARREAIEAREAELVQEREEALNELDNTRMTVQELSEKLDQKDLRVRELEQHERTLQEQLDKAVNQAESSFDIDETQVKSMLDAIARLRSERDQLRSDLEFLQIEMRFKVQAFEAKLTHETEKPSNKVQSQGSQALITKLTEELNAKGFQSRKLQTAISAALVAVQRLQAQNELLREHAAGIVASQDTATSKSDAELKALQSQLYEQEVERSTLSTALTDMQQQLQAKSEEFDNASMQSQAVLSAKDEEIAQVKLNLSDADSALRDEKERRMELEQEVEQLEASCKAAQQELADAMERCERLQAMQTSGLSPDGAARALTEEIKLLEGRVMRRTEQIGIHQHDIKRLETNMRLLEDRLEEVTGELDMAETEKAAMLEDCTTAREERDGAKKALEQAEIEVERLTAVVKQAEEATSDSHARLAAADVRMKELEAAKAEELTTAAKDVAERDVRIGSLLENLESARMALDDARMRATGLEKELEAVKEATTLTVEELRGQIQSDRGTSSDELAKRADELEFLTRALEVSRSNHEEAVNLLQMKDGELKCSIDEVQRLTFELESVTAARQDSVDVLRLKEVELIRQTDEARRLSSDLEAVQAKCQESMDALLVKEDMFKWKMDELEAAKASHQEAVSMLQLKDRELDLNACELRRLASEFEVEDAKHKEVEDGLRMKNDQLTQTGERISALEAEKADLLVRLAAFETDANHELSETTTLRSVLEEERHYHEEKVKKMEEEIECLKAEMEQSKAREQPSNDLEARQEETATLLESTKKEFEEQRALYDALLLEQREASASREAEAADLREQIAKLTIESERLLLSVEEETSKRKSEHVAHEEALRDALEKQESSSAVEHELRQSIERYQEQLGEVRTSLMSIEDENTAMQSDMDNLSAECHRAKLERQSLEKQLSSNGKELSALRDELARVRETLSESQKSGKTAEMNLLLIGQQHERAVSSLQAQLKEHEKHGARAQELQSIISEMKEQINEMDSLLRAKCAEIEDNDDKFIQLLKEKKKLSSKVESLTKKNNNLQNKLAAASTVQSKAPSPPFQEHSRQIFPSEPVPSAFVMSSTSAASPVVLNPSSAKSLVGLSSRSTPPHTKTPESSRRVSATMRARNVTPPMDQIPTTSYIGKKRPLPDDADSVRAPVEARFADSDQPVAGSSTSPMPSSYSILNMPSMPFTSEITSTPRHRRPLQALRTGFTPVRGHGTLRPTLSQPSPIRKSTASSGGAVIADVTNSPPKAKRVFTAEPGSTASRTQKPTGKGWLGKIRGGGTNPLLRTRQQPSAEDLS